MSKTQAWVNIYEGEPMEIFSERMSAIMSVRDCVEYRGTHHLIWDKGEICHYGKITDLDADSTSEKDAWGRLYAMRHFPVEINCIHAVIVK